MRLIEHYRKKINDYAKHGSDEKIKIVMLEIMENSTLILNQTFNDMLEEEKPEHLIDGYNTRILKLNILRRVEELKFLVLNYGQLQRFIKYCYEEIQLVDKSEPIGNIADILYTECIEQYNYDEVDYPSADFDFS